ncbi:hypothetical protein EDB89DRAFT_1900586 [Lactarius sanguifluus]|nr:hypothetical protein EDB89DRAFT_1900586 [Lactarius sanguifluus]
MKTLVKIDGPVTEVLVDEWGAAVKQRWGGPGRKERKERRGRLDEACELEAPQKQYTCRDGCSVTVAHVHTTSPPLRDISQPPTLGLLESHAGNPWHPFGDRLAYEWARYHYVKLQSSAADVQQGLDLWRATVMIGPQPTRTLPQWMQETYELNVRDVLSVFEEQLASKEFDGEFEYTPYEEYNEMGSRVYSNLMSGIWAFHEALQDTISQDKKTHGAMFVPIIAGSDKTTVSVATGHQEYHPVYVSLGNITNTAWRGHGNGVVPVAFLPIPKRVVFNCLELVFAPLKPYMTEPKVMKCPDGHFRRTIFGLGPYIADYPEQVYLSGVISTWCPKCDALPTDLDGSGSHHRSHIKTDLLIKTFNPGVLWDDFGLRHNIVRCQRVAVKRVTRECDSSRDEYSRPRVLVPGHLREYEFTLFRARVLP